MKIAIIGAGFTGLAAGVELVDRGYRVVIFEADGKPGGLATGFQEKGWGWSLEKYYHHIFANDKEIIALAKKVAAKIIWREPVTSVWREGRMSQLDTPTSLLRSPELSLPGKVRMSMGLGYLKMLGEEQGIKLEKDRVVERLPKLVGREGYEKVWKPLLLAKFGKYVNEVNMAWFWARIAKRTKKLGYFEGGFEKLAEKCVEYLERKGGEVKFKYQVSRIKDQGDNKYRIGDLIFDKVLITTPAPLVDKLVGKGINWPKINYLWGQTLVLELEKSLMNTYWLNVLEKDWPFLVVVEHTNFMDRRHYRARHLVYVGNYLESGDQRLEKSAEKLLADYWPYLKKINPQLEREWITRSWKFQTPFAQPVFPVNYSKVLPKMKTKLPGVSVANMSMVYPWDRGTNYAVELGERVVKENVLL